MKFLTFSLLVAVSCVAAQDSCDSPMTHFTSFLGEQTIAATNQVFEHQMQTCLKIEFPRKLSDIISKCFMQTTKFSLKDMSVAQDITLPDRAGYLNWYRSMAECRLDAMGITYSETDIDTNTFLDTILAEKWSYDTKDEAIFHGILQQCVNTRMTGERPAYQQFYRMEKCVVETMMTSCDLVGKGSGLTLLILKAFYSLMEPAKCNGFKVPANITTDILAECLVEANQEWESESGSTKYEGSMLNHNTKDKIKTAFEFFRNFGKKIMVKASTCAVTKAGLFTQENGMEFDNAIKMITSFDWKDVDARDQVVAAINECRVEKQTDGNDIDVMGGFISQDHRDQHTSLVLQRFKFERCFGPKFVDICGLNNEISNVYYPMMNNDINHMIIEDFQAKKGFTAFLHVNSIFRDQFMDFVKQLI